MICFTPEMVRLMYCCACLPRLNKLYQGEFPPSGYIINFGSFLETSVLHLPHRIRRYRALELSNIPGFSGLNIDNPVLEQSGLG